MKHAFDRRLRAGLLLVLGGALGLEQVSAQAVPAHSGESGDPSAAGLAASIWFKHAQAELRLEEYGFAPVPREPGVWSAPNRAQALRSRVSAAGLAVFPREAGADGVGAAWTLRLRTSAFGRVGELVALDTPEVSSDGQRVELDHGPLREWFENRAEGLEQGWTIARRPSGEGQVWIGLEQGGGFALSVDDGALGGVFVGADGAIELPYRDLLVLDANGRELPAWLDSSAVDLGIRIDDAGAAYPLTVDPWLNGPDWTADSDQVGAHYGFTVASAGDVNGDGYADVVVGAPDYDLGELNEGRVWLYHGSSGGLSGSDWSAESDQAAAQYGASLAGAGDVDGDGYDDVIVGAPFWDNGDTDEGRVWVYHGSAVGIGGSDWIAEGNQADGRYGSSVAGAGDVDDDGYADVVVGAPYYDVTLAEEGRAWLYRGSAGGLIDFAAWREEGKQVGALFGRAVDGAGDVNGDGFDDVVVGAPFYSNGQSAEGQAFLYTGCRRLGTTYCTANANSTGEEAAISAWCSASIAAGSFQLESEPVPNQPGIFFHGPNQAQNPFGNGFLCASGTIVRGAPVGTSANKATYVYDNSDAKHSLAGYAGSTRHFQHWYRDPAGGGHGFNTSNAVSVLILP